MVPDADITLSAEDRPIGGLGIFLIRQIMNEVRYERIEDRNVLTMEKKL
jgi:serine/threonine-protein kinase RsbW